MRQNAFVSVQAPRITTNIQADEGFGICCKRNAVYKPLRSVHMSMENSEPSSLFRALTGSFSSSSEMDKNIVEGNPAQVPLEASWVASTFSKRKILDEEFEKVFPIPRYLTEDTRRDSPKEAEDEKGTPQSQSSSPAPSPSPGGTRRKSFLQLCIVLAAFMVNEAAEYGYQHQNKTHAATSLASTQINKATYAGSFSDPKHPLCQRQVELEPDAKANYQYIISGEDGSPGCMPGFSKKKWQVPAQYDPKQGTILADFSLKGGPKDLQGTWDPARSVIQWADGNIWPKL
mmetsp:Transcript_1395/g.2327  ORF Transcript_1395/g.2327 Transcript_1395/m.2327 type:complete len:288 (+) Transcript_1395:86-949(+)|eukprot:CAMPEP_0184693480 /NCGR_PEP_ID=MMETSP0313-20130426/1685_1 /TAXON_ID=2792 /ORGANISM="Porphyridium aerugineum, Strain SAG 1380-2" /LENGTH=287 /DNA_ID=CAMNT_0027151563 /DNA_START=46 /DNA_END=909 /DNA_ORIENTATION=-